MATTFKTGDHVEWNSEAGRVRGGIIKKVVADVDAGAADQPGQAKYSNYNRAQVSENSCRA
jgi:hypothetical protein